MKKFVLVVVSLFAVQAVSAQYTPPPDITKSQAAASVDLTLYKAWTENQHQGEWNAIQALQQLTSNLAAIQASIAVLQSQLSDLQTRISTLEAKVAATTPAAPVPAIQIEAESASNVPSGQIQNTQDGGATQRKVVLTSGMRLMFPVTISANGNYVLSARMSTDPACTGTLSVHFEYPSGTNVSGPIGDLSANGTWKLFDGAASALPAGTGTLFFVVDTLPSGGNAYLNWIQLQQK